MLDPNTKTKSLLIIPERNVSTFNGHDHDYMEIRQRLNDYDRLKSRDRPLVS